VDVRQLDEPSARPVNREVPPILLERASQHSGNPFFEVFETGRRLHATLDAGVRWLILDFDSGPPPMADVAMSFALVRASRRAARAGGALVIVVADPVIESRMREAESAAAGLEIVPTFELAQERVAQLRDAATASTA
jgi:hypothetical protein